jgi:hypothetical protein
MSARCVVCGAFFRIPEEADEVAFPLGSIPSGPLPENSPKQFAAAKPPKPAAGSRSSSGLALADPDPDAVQFDEEGSEGASREPAEVFGLAPDDPGAGDDPEGGEEGGGSAASRKRDWADRAAGVAGTGPDLLNPDDLEAIDPYEEADEAEREQRAARKAERAAAAGMAPATDEEVRK